MFYYKITYCDQYKKQEYTHYGVVIASSYSEAVEKLVNDYGPEIDSITVVEEIDTVVTKEDIDLGIKFLDK